MAHARAQVLRRLDREGLGADHQPGLRQHARGAGGHEVTRLPRPSPQLPAGEQHPPHAPRDRPVPHLDAPRPAWTPLDTIVAALADQQAELSTLLVDLDEPGWQRPSRCEGWTVADVVLHLAQTNEMALASARGRLAEAMGELAGDLAPASSIDDGADLMVARERG
ncbi:MAG: hypothetical protein E6G17_09805, partial [Actinobacteria bacterium]